MATEGKNLSAYDARSLGEAKRLRIALVHSEWNQEITTALLKGGLDTLRELGLQEDNILVRGVPGSYELPLGAQWIAEHENVDAIVAIGSVIQGETRHFEFVCQAVAQGIKDVSLKTGVPVIFCVLTDDTIDQARARSGGQHGNKGVEAAVAAVRMASLKKQITKQG